VAPIGPTSLQTRLVPMAVSRQMISVVAGETFSWASGSWTELSVTGPAGTGNLAYDAKTSQLIFLGQPDVTNGPCSTWSWNGVRWRPLTPTHEPPSGQGLASLAYDTTSTQLLYVAAVGATTQTEETWMWSGDNWAEMAPVSSPPPRNDAALAYDSATRDLILFGGYVVTSSQLLRLDDTWQWDGSN